MEWVELPACCGEAELLPHAASASMQKTLVYPPNMGDGVGHRCSGPGMAFSSRPVSHSQLAQQPREAPAIFPHAFGFRHRPPSIRASRHPLASSGERGISVRGNNCWRRAGDRFTRSAASWLSVFFCLTAHFSPLTFGL